MFKNKMVLVAGGGGFIGSHVVQKMIDLGAKVRATVHNKSCVIFNDDVEYVRCDLTQKRDCISATSGVDFVFMCAANTQGAAVVEHTPMAHVPPHVLMNTLMLESAYEANVKKFLFISSNAVYPVTDYPVSEPEMMSGDLFEKYYCVGWMKRFSEILCEMYATKINNPMSVVIVRPANAYGEYDNFDLSTSHVLPALIRKAVERHDPM